MMLLSLQTVASMWSTLASFRQKCSQTNIAQSLFLREQYDQSFLSCSLRLTLAASLCFNGPFTMFHRMVFFRDSKLKFIVNLSQIKTPSVWPERLFLIFFFVLVEVKRVIFFVSSNPSSPNSFPILVFMGHLFLSGFCFVCN